jgi:hypothetical protein
MLCTLRLIPSFFSQGDIQQSLTLFVLRILLWDAFGFDSQLDSPGVRGHHGRINVIVKPRIGANENIASLDQSKDGQDIENFELGRVGRA